MSADVRHIVLTTPRERGNLLSAKNIITAGQARYVTKQHYLIKQWLPFEGTGVLVGPSNTGKTFIALDMAMSVAGGGGGPTGMVTRSVRALCCIWRLRGASASKTVWRRSRTIEG